VQGEVREPLHDRADDRGLEHVGGAVVVARRGALPEETLR
jgi:hypothetical protein